MELNVPAETEENSEQAFIRALVDDCLIHQRVDHLAIVPADRTGRRRQIHHREVLLRIDPPVRAAGAAALRAATRI